MSKIVRATHERDYTCIANAALRDERLTWDARGVLAYLLSHPDNWTVMQAQLAKAGPDGDTVVRGALRELEATGYLDRDRRSTGFGWEVTTTLRELPRPVAVPTCENPTWESLQQEIAAEQVSNKQEDQLRFSEIGGPEDGFDPFEALAGVPESDPAAVQRSFDDAFAHIGGRRHSMPAVRPSTEDDGGGARLSDARGTPGGDAGDRTEWGPGLPAVEGATS